LLVKGVLTLKSRKQKLMLKEDAMQRQQRLIKLAQAGEQAERQLGLEEKEKKEDVNKHKWKGTM
jgi:hypothetical protein